MCSGIHVKHVYNVNNKKSLELQHKTVPTTTISVFLRS